MVHGPHVARLRRPGARCRRRQFPNTRAPLRRAPNQGTCMIARTRLGLEVLAAGLVLGVIGDSLLRAQPWGLNVTLCALALTAAATWLVRRNSITPGPHAPWLAPDRKS